MRPTLDEYFIKVAEVVSSRAACLRKQYGCVLVKDKYIVSTGYNAPPVGEPHCEICTKSCETKDEAAYSGCPSSHAEMNALLLASKEEMQGATLYLAGFDVRTGTWISAKPCEICLRLIKNAGVARVVNKDGLLYERGADNLLVEVKDD